MTQFNEQLYLALYADVAALVSQGQYASALDYYNQVGQFTPGKEGFFTGTSGNDSVTGYGIDVDLYGIDYTVEILGARRAVFIPKSFGVGEIDTLVGRTDPNVEDGFFLSALIGSHSRNNANNPDLGNSQPLYVGQRNRDYAIVENFTANKDYVSLSGKPTDYIYRFGADSLKIYTIRNDLIGIVEGTFDLQPRRFLADNTFRLSARVTTRGFNDDIYLLNNPEVRQLIQNGVFDSALDHYIQVGQFTQNKNSAGQPFKGVFTGAEIGDPVSGSSNPLNSADDTLIAYGGKTQLCGVGLTVVNNDSGSFIQARSLGVGQIDTLVGSFNGRDEFLLGIEANQLNPTSQMLYVGTRNRDYALIQNFEAIKDTVILAGTPDQYRFATVGGNFRISTTRNDLVGIVEGISNLTVTDIFSDTQTFAMKATTI